MAHRVGDGQQFVGDDGRALGIGDLVHHVQHLVLVQQASLFGHCGALKAHIGRDTAVQRLAVLARHGFPDRAAEVAPDRLTHRLGVAQLLLQLGHGDLVGLGKTGPLQHHLQRDLAVLSSQHLGVFVAVELGPQHALARRLGGQFHARDGVQPVLLGLAQQGPAAQPRQQAQPVVQLSLDALQRGPHGGRYRSPGQAAQQIGDLLHDRARALGEAGVLARQCHRAFDAAGPTAQLAGLGQVAQERHDGHGADGGAKPVPPADGDERIGAVRQRRRVKDADQIEHHLAQVEQQLGLFGRGRVRSRWRGCRGLGARHRAGVDPPRAQLRRAQRAAAAGHGPPPPSSARCAATSQPITGSPPSMRKRSRCSFGVAKPAAASTERR